MRNPISAVNRRRSGRTTIPAEDGPDGTAMETTDAEAADGDAADSTATDGDAANGTTGAGKAGKKGVPAGAGRATGRIGQLLSGTRALVLVVVLAALVAGATWYGHYRAGQRDSAVRDAVAAASPAAKAIFSYDYRSFDASVTNGRAFVTGAFANEYAQTTSTLKATAVSEKAVVLAEVSATGVIEASGDRVQLIVFLNQYRRNANTTGEKIDQNRVVLEMVPDGGEWKVTKATAL